MPSYSGYPTSGGFGPLTGAFRKYHKAKEAKRRASKRSQYMRAMLRKYGGSWGRKIAKKSWPFYALQAAYYGWRNRGTIKSTWKYVRGRYMDRTPLRGKVYNEMRRAYKWFDAPETPPYWPRRSKKPYYGGRRYSRYGRRPYRSYRQDWR